MIKNTAGVFDKSFSSLSIKKLKSAKIIRVLFTNEILFILLKFFSPQDAVEFLSCHPTGINNPIGWGILKRMLKISDVPRTDSPKGLLPIMEYANDRDLILHIIRKYGLCCTECFTLLDGEHGFFCCTSLCSNCSISKFKGCAYVDSVVRFYLCGNDNMTVRGKAFLVHPFWYSDDNESLTIINEHGSSLRLAELIYKEKMFFALHASDLQRPRDDKAGSLSHMIYNELKYIVDENSNDDNEDGAVDDEDGGYGKSTSHHEVEFLLNSDTESKEETQSTDYIPFSGVVSTMTSSFSNETSNRELTEDEYSRLTGRLQNTWLADLPDSLLDVFNIAMQSLKNDLRRTEVRSSIQTTQNTMPLRDLVKNLHGKVSASAKIMS